MATGMSAPGMVIPATSGSCWIRLPVGPSVASFFQVFISSSVFPTCLQWGGLTRKSRLALTTLTAVSPDYLPDHGQMAADGLSHNTHTHLPKLLPNFHPTDRHTHQSGKAESLGSGWL